MSQHYSDNDEHMSDTDSEVIPSSQPDSSMVYTESQVALMKRAKGDAEMQPEQSQTSQFSASGSQRNPMEDQLSCGICLSVMDNPFLVLPCMHSYCRECLDHWWQNQANCPICKQRSQLAKHNFHLANIIDQFRRDANRVSRRQLDDSAREDLYPRGRRPHMLAPMSLPSTQSQSQSQGPLLFDAVLMIPSFGSAGMGTQSQSQANVPQPLPDTLPGGNLVFPCPSCYPENNTGYRCPDPIHPPTMDQIQAEQQAYRPGGTPIRPPGRGESRVGLQAAVINQLPGATSHTQCAGCSTYIPAGWHPERQKCGDCDIPLCSLYDPQGCPNGFRLLPRNALSGGTIDAHHLWQHTPPHIRANTDEEYRFSQYIQSGHLSIDTVLEHLFQMKLDTEKAAGRRNLPNGGQVDEDDGAYDDEVQELDRRCEARWGAQAHFCDDSVTSIIHEMFFVWWMNQVNILKNAQAQRPGVGQAVGRFFGMAGNGGQPQVPGFPDDCWYGFECRTQRNPGHASRYNHICHNTHPQNAGRYGGRSG
ncbi:hypothetical protein FS837_009097 [Tulasnella sp. UAMH 9824]|nr:hypothetical protein FS837_009097 [Tulasnella sp. UAMH 9824]